MAKREVAVRVAVRVSSRSGRGTHSASFLQLATCVCTCTCIGAASISLLFAVSPGATAFGGRETAWKKRSRGVCEGGLPETVSAGRRAFVYVRPSSPAGEQPGGDLPEVYSAFGPQRLGGIQCHITGLRTNGRRVHGGELGVWGGGGELGVWGGRGETSNTFWGDH